MKLLAVPGETQSGAQQQKKTNQQLPERPAKCRPFPIEGYLRFRLTASIGGAQPAPLPAEPSSFFIPQLAFFGQSKYE